MDQSTDNKNALAVTSPANTAQLSVFSNIANFETAQRMAKALSSSDLVPENYRGDGKMGNCLIAMEVAARTGASILAVVQNLNIIHGRPSWGSSFIIAALNSCGRFSPIRFVVDGAGDKMTCRATCRDLASGDTLDGPTVSIEMAKAEGWYGRNGSKWKTMPELMLRYRAAAFFGRLYAPDVLMGMHTQEEVEDVGPVTRDITPAMPAPAMVNPNAEPPREVSGEVLPPKKGRPKKSAAPESVVPAESVQAADVPPGLERPAAPAPASEAAESAPVDNLDIPSFLRRDNAPAAAEPAQAAPAPAAKTAGDLF